MYTHVTFQMLVGNNLCTYTECKEWTYEVWVASTFQRVSPEYTHACLWTLVPYVLESNPHLFYSFRGLKNQMRIRIACGLDSRSWAGFWKNDRAALRAVRTIQYNNLLFCLVFIILYSILYNIYNLLFIRLAVITHNWIRLPCRQGTVEGNVRIRTAN